MNKFGWSYPPGCSGTPADEPDPPCEICGLDPDGGEGGCQCPECGFCGVAGVPLSPGGHCAECEARLLVADRVLAFEFDRWGLGRCTVRYYLIELAHQCWVDGERFSGKRPFGNSGWQLDLYKALVVGGFIAGKLDTENDWLDKVDEKAGDLIIEDCFYRLQRG